MMRRMCSSRSKPVTRGVQLEERHESYAARQEVISRNVMIALTDWLDEQSNGCRIEDGQVKQGGSPACEQERPLRTNELP